MSKRPLSSCLASRRVAVAAAAAFVVLFVGMAALLLGPLAATVFFVASGGGFVLWLLTTYRRRIDPGIVIVPYLFTIILFILHVYEEYLTDFEVAITDISGFHVIERDFLTVAAFVAPILWLTGAILLLKRTHLGYYFLSFFFVAMILAELAHYVFPFLEDGTFHYVSGMYTAALPLIPALYGLWLVLRALRDGDEAVNAST